METLEIAYTENTISSISSDMVIVAVWNLNRI